MMCLWVLHLQQQTELCKQLLKQQPTLICRLRLKQTGEKLRQLIKLQGVELMDAEQHAIARAAETMQEVAARHALYSERHAGRRATNRWHASCMQLRLQCRTLPVLQLMLDSIAVQLGVSWRHPSSRQKRRNQMLDTATNAEASNGSLRMRVKLCSRRGEL